MDHGSGAHRVKMTEELGVCGNYEPHDQLPIEIITKHCRFAKIKDLGFQDCVLIIEKNEKNNNALLLDEIHLHFERPPDSSVVTLGARENGF